MGEGQRWVWDFPRPPALEPVTHRIEVRAGQTLLVETTTAWAVLETSHPPTYYVPRDAVNMEHLKLIAKRTGCEWKGEAHYFDVVRPGHRLRAAAWTYPRPTQRFRELAGALAFDPRQVACFVDGERARPQEGGFYGGWITSHVVGPFKGAPGTMHW